jgi:uncharacterized membrane protein YhhN
MKQKTRFLLIVFWIVTLADLLLTWFNKNELRWFTKPLLMPLLATTFYFGSAKKNGQLFYFILLALFLSWGGDVLLQIKGMFIPGLVSFLLAHVCYILYFIKTNPGKKGLLQFQPLIGLPVLVYILLFLYLLYPFLDALKIPVTVYGITIGTMLLMAINTKRKLTGNVSALFFNGALQFVISDSILAVNLFAYPDTVLSICVMLTYCSAQYLIVRGALLNEG